MVVPSGSCGGMIRHHLPGLFDDDPNTRARARALGDRTFELVGFLVDVMGMDRVAASYAGTVTYHDSCAGLRELGVKAQPRVLLGTVAGLTLTEMAGAGNLLRLRRHVLREISRHFRAHGVRQMQGHHRHRRRHAAGRRCRAAC